jgi:hypothetical protein
MEIKKEANASSVSTVVVGGQNLAYRLHDGFGMALR